MNCMPLQRVHCPKLQFHKNEYGVGTDFEHGIPPMQLNPADGDNKRRMARSRDRNSRLVPLSLTEASPCESFSNNSAMMGLRVSWASG
jgi:hypothetical protein